MSDTRRQPRAQFAFAGGKPPPRHLTAKEAAEERRKKLCAKYEAFFAPIVDALRQSGETGKLLKLMQTVDCNDRGFEWQKFAPLCLNFGFWGPNNSDRHRPYVYLYIREPDRQRAERIFEHLRLREGQLNSALREINPAFELTQWSLHTGSPNPQADYCSVGMMINGTIDDPQERLDEIRDWMLAFYPALKSVLEPHLEEILSDLNDD